MTEENNNNVENNENKEIVTKEEKSKIPNSLSECIEKDKYAEELLEWSKRIKKFGKVLFIILIILGIISSIVGCRVEVPYEAYYGEIGYKLEANPSLFISSIVIWSLYVFIEYCTYHVISLLLGSLSTIVQNTKISALVSLYEANKEEK